MKRAIAMAFSTAARIEASPKSAVEDWPRRWPTYTVTVMPLSRLYEIVSTSPWRTVTLWPTACDTSVSAAVAPPERAAARMAAATRSSSAVATGNGCSPDGLAAATGAAAAVARDGAVIDGLYSGSAFAGSARRSADWAWAIGRGL